MPKQDHTHTYVRWQKKKGVDKIIAGEKVYKCIGDNCSHYLVMSMMEGKKTACPKCGTEFNLTKEDLLRIKPLCLNCRDTKEGRVYQQAKQRITEILQGGSSEPYDN